ncbi:flagellar basal-body MS-ring/collar protein FliF [Arthrobacter sp. STN4]|uniref:flagellar basal-body MS-ring/collar protein FliF n=1 Tax=Arthrobacter sp. STN4 TaxID=2923276 RepID=UPI00211A2370|nr:flagellar basal-body MS-ring/collar protein FliF [Arthrobacter sp. STN4]MCQ9162501.1 flagellar M-ring protein FliF [Arthrobacter sp. STN4]
MPPVLSQFMARASGTLKGFSTAQRTLAVIGVAVLLLGSVALGSWLTRPTYAPLFSGVAAADASAIVAQLKTDNVPYQLANGGSTILVPDANVYDERLKAASAGLPAATTAGYSLLDTMGVTSSEFQQNVTYKRAMEGELAKTVMAMNGVQNASVKLAIPESTVFTSTKADPTASVFVESSGSSQLSPDQVDAVVHLVSSSVEGLTPANVSVIDAKGNVLSAPGTALGGANKQATEYEKRTTSAVQAMLDRVLGPGNSTVALTAAVDKSSSEVVKESFASPSGAPALNESSTTNKSTGGTGTGAGVLGPDNIAVPNGTNTGGAAESTATTKNNAVDKTTANTSIPAGALQKQSLAVAVDTQAAKRVDAATLTDMVVAAAGIDRARGDVVSLKIVPFSTAQADAAKAALDAAKAEADSAAAAKTWRTILLGAGAVLAALLALVLYARKNRRQVRELVDLGEQREAPAALDPADPGTLETTALPSIPEPVALPAVENNDADSKRASINALATADPEKAAALLRTLMDERTPV